MSGGGMSGAPPLQRHMSDYGPGRTWDSYGGGNRRSSGPREYGGRRSEDYGSGSVMTAEEWNRPLPQNERLERSLHMWEGQGTLKLQFQDF